MRTALSPQTCSQLPRLARFRRSSLSRVMASAPVEKTWKLDASSLFFRKRSADGKFTTDGDPAWPKNGFLFKGVEKEPGWVQLSGAPDKWLPIGGHGNTYLWPQ